MATVDDIKAGLADRAAEMCAYLFPEGKIDGAEFRVGSLSGEAGQSLAINLNGKLGVWQDFATGDHGSNLLELWSRTRCNGNFRRAQREAGEWLGLGDDQDHGRIVGEWTYTDARGSPWLRVVRRDRPNGDKSFAQFDIKAGRWIGKGHTLPAKRPLYRLHTIHGKTRGGIVLVEGERCAEALVALGIEATTTLGGRGQVAQADFRPLAGWEVRIWRDADKPGEEYAAVATRQLLALGASILHVPIPEGVAKGWDVADAIADGWTIEDVCAQLEAAEPVKDLGGEEARNEEEPARSRFTFVDDVELETRQPPPWLINDVLISETVNQIVGPPGSMKSFLMLDAAAHIRLGRPWHGRAVMPGPVVYVLAEGARSFGLRIRAWKLHHGHTDAIGLHFLPLPVQFADRGEVDELLAAVSRLKFREPPRFVIDTQARCSVGINENDATEMGRMLAGAERIQRETSGTIALVHHTPRDGERERGSNAQRGGVDATLLVTADGDIVTLKVDRQKDGEDGQVLNFRKRVIELGADDTGRMRSSCVLTPVSDADVQRTPVGVGDLTDSVRTLLETLRQAPDGSASSATLQKVTGLRERTFFNALTRAKQWGFVDGTSRAYRMTPNGRGLFG